MKTENPTDKAENPIIYEPEYCSECNQHLSAKNTVTGEELCSNEECKNYNKEMYEKLFPVHPSMITATVILSKLPQLTDEELISISQESDELLGNGSLGGKIRKMIREEGKQSALNYLTKVRGWSLEQSRIYCGQL